MQLKEGLVREVEGMEGGKAPGPPPRVCDTRCVTASKWPSNTLTRETKKHGLNKVS